MPTVLTSWKEISDHLGKGVRTVQRWEVELGLPVHRSDAGHPRAIFALREELEAWARSHPLAPAGAVVASLYREIGLLRELIGALSERLDSVERTRLSSRPTLSNAVILRNDLEAARVSLRATIDRSQALREESRTARGQSCAVRGQSAPLSLAPRSRAEQG